MQRNEGGNAIVSVPLAGTSFPKLDECVTALSSADPQMRATAAEALLDFPVTETRQGDRSLPWAYALIDAGAIVPLLGLVQAVKRDGAEGLKPCDCPGNTEPVLRAGDFALLVLTELAEVAAALLADEGWDVRYDEEVNRPVFLDEQSGLQQSSPPLLRVTNGDWISLVLVEVITLLQPLDVHSGTGMPRWPVSVLRHIPVSMQRTSTISVLDIAIQEGEAGECTRVLIRGPWAGSNGEVEGEVDPNDIPGSALHSWHDATIVAALIPHLSARTWSPVNPPRVLIIGLRCGAVPAFLCRHLPGVRVDVVEPDEEIVKIARDLFNLNFDEVRWSNLDEYNRSAQLSRPSYEGRFRVWVGISEWQFLNLLPENCNFIGILGSMPDIIEHGAQRMHEFQALALRTINNERGLGFVALAARSGTKLQETAAALSCAWNRSFARTLILCDIKQRRAFQNEGSTIPLKKNMKQISPKFGSFKWESLNFNGAPLSGGIFICLPSLVADKHKRTHLDLFHPSLWYAALEKFIQDSESAGMATSPCFPFTLESSSLNLSLPLDETLPALSNGRVLHVSFCMSSRFPGQHVRAESLSAQTTSSASEDETIRETFRDNTCSKTANLHFEGSIDDVLSSNFWEAILGNKLTCNAHSTAEPSYRICSSSFSHCSRYRNDIEEHGYIWGDVVIPESETKHLAKGIHRLVAAGWPPVCVFVSDLAWSVADRLWSCAEAILGADEGVVLEPSLAAFKLEPLQDLSGKRYIGNNFGQPHRDYTHEEVFGSETSQASTGPKIISIWLPLVDITLENGCMYVVPRAGDGSGGRGEDEVEIPSFDMKTVRALAPAKAGTLFAWAGNTVHWGASCAKQDEKTPRLSLAFVFRNKNTVCDLQGKPLTRDEFQEGLTMERRLELIRHSLSCFEHWYGDISQTITKLGKFEQGQYTKH